MLLAKSARPWGVGQLSQAQPRVFERTLTESPAARRTDQVTQLRVLTAPPKRWQSLISWVPNPGDAKQVRGARSHSSRSREVPEG